VPAPSEASRASHFVWKDLAFAESIVMAPSPGVHGLGPPVMRDRDVIAKTTTVMRMRSEKTPVTAPNQDPTKKRQRNNSPSSTRWAWDVNPRPRLCYSDCRLGERPFKAIVKPCCQKAGSRGGAGGRPVDT